MIEPTDRHRRLREVFEAALAQPPAARAAFLDQSLADDTELRAEVDGLLQAHSDARSFLEHPPGPAVLPDDPPLSGRRVGPYELVREIGRGGMGAVYLARRADGHYEKEVAIKLVPAAVGGVDRVRRFRQEQQILASLEHPHIAHLLDAGTTDEGVPYVVMEYVAGEPIDQYCDRLQLRVRDRLTLFATVCDTVEYAHRNLVVHRDLKPSNILVAADGAIKLLDFGIAKLLDEAEPGPTRTGVLPMTPEYASPEQVTGVRVTTASDVYALGLLLYELLTGRRAHNLETSGLEEIVRVVCDSTPERPSVAVARLEEPARTEVSQRRGTTPEKLIRQLAGDLDQIVQVALRKEPERRYGSVVALATDVRHHLANRPVVARGDTWSYRLRKFVERNTLPTAAAVVAVAALGGGLALTLWQAREAERARHDAEVQRAQAERRFGDVRKLATSFVFEFHDAIANLAGATGARQLVVSKGLEYLDSLAADAGENQSLQRDLADAYDRFSEIQAAPYASNVGDAAGSLTSIEKAIAIRETLARDTAPGSPEQLALVGSLVRLGDAYQATGRAQDAVNVHRQVVERGEAALSAGVNDNDLRRRVASASNRLCGVLQGLGDAAGALESCQKSLALHEALLASEPGSAAAREAAAAAHLAIANAYRLNGRALEARDATGRALDGLRALARESPENGRLRMQLATALIQQGLAEAVLGRTSDAVSSQAEAVELLDGLYDANPTNQRVRTLLSFTLLRRAPLLLAAGRSEEAAASTRRGLAMLKAQAERPSAGPNELNDYAAWLLTCEPATERRPAEALGFARRAVAAQIHPVYLDTLALAYFHNGQADLAVKTGEQALALVPSPAAGARPSGLRTEIEGHLALFRQGR